MQIDGKSLNQTFIPKTILRKTQMKQTNPMLQKNQFQKTHGNIYVQLDPPQIKFNGYEINKINTLSFKIINKAPIPQRFNILPPQQPHFSIKVQKKGNIPSGMYETVQVTFKATDYKYLYDVVKINTQTQNFIVPLYAYPTIPNLDKLFPKLIDFGTIEVKSSQTFLYPIRNPTPIDYKFDFMYKKQCAEIMINPLEGTIPGNGQVIVEVGFIPARKMTYSAEVYFKMQQFDFQPIYIQIIGTGKEKDMSKTFKRLKSSKLVPLKKDEQQGQNDIKQRMNQTQTFLNQSATKQGKKLLQTNIRKLPSKFPKLLNATVKPTSTINNRLNQSSVQQTQQLNKSLSHSATFSNSEQRLFLNRFNKVQQLDKQKEIKFNEYLGDRAMTEKQLQVQRSIVQEMKVFRNNLLRQQCEERYNPEKQQSAEVEFLKIKAQYTTWDQNKNDQLFERRTILNKFVIAASKIIQTRRIKKRFEKIKEFLSDCSSKQEVAKKVQISYQKSLHAHSDFAFKGQIDLEFNRLSLDPTYFDMQFSEGKQKFSERVFKTEGKPQFDDLTVLELNQQHQIQKMQYNSLTFPPQFVYLNKLIPPQRVSGQEQFSVKSSSLPATEPVQLLSIVSKPFDIPNHYFIHQKHHTALFNQYSAIDQKDPAYLFSIDEPIQDQFEGWTKGEFDVLKSKLLKNTGIEYRTSSGYNWSTARNDLGFLGDWARNLSPFIEGPTRDDQLSDDDSDEQKYEEAKRQKVQEFLQKIQVNPQVKTRRQKNQVEDEQKKIRDKIEKNLTKDKLKQVTKYIEKVRNFNKTTQKPENLLLL